MNRIQRDFLVITLFCLVSLGAQGQSRCSKVFQTSHIVQRLGYVTLQSSRRTRLWFASYLKISNNTEPTWEFHPNEFRMSDSEGNESEHYKGTLFGKLLGERERETLSTQNLGESSLQFVYDTYLEEVEQRGVFTKDFIESLRTEDLARLEPNFTLWTAFSETGEKLSVWGLYFHRVGEHDGKIELVRLAKTKHTSFTLKQALSLVSEYLNALGVDSGTIMVRSDQAGSRLYRRMGAEIVQEYEPGKFILELSIEHFLSLFEALEITNGSRPVKSQTRYFYGDVWDVYF